MAQIEVTEQSVRDLAGSAVFARGALLAGQVSGLTAAGPRVEAVVDGVRVTVHASAMDAQCVDARCECPDPAPCPHAVAALLAWIRAAVQRDAAALLADFEYALAEAEPDPDYLDELADEIEDLLDEDLPAEDLAAVRDLADQVLNLLEAVLVKAVLVKAGDDADLIELIERVEEIYLEARERAGSSGSELEQHSSL